MSQLYAFEIESSPCPVCQAQLVYASDELRADQRCERCGGVWLSEDRLKRELDVYDLSRLFHTKHPSANFCPTCGPVPLDKGVIEGHDGLSCSSCHGVFLYQPFSAPRAQEPARMLTGYTPSAELLASPTPPTPLPTSLPTSLSESPSGSPSGASPEPSTRTDGSSRRERSSIRGSIRAPIGAYVRGPAQAKSAQKSSLRDRVNTPTTRAAATAVRDLIWFGALVCAIGASLWYWMTP